MVTTEGQSAGLAGQSPQAIRRVVDGLPAFEAACSAVATTRLGDPEESARLLARWFEGVALLDAITVANSDEGSGNSGAEPRVVAAMTRLATAWLSPRFAGESRVAVRERIAGLRPVEQNERMVELMDKNTEGTLTPGERREFSRLHEFYEKLQGFVDTALYSTPAPS